MLTDIGTGKLSVNSNDGKVVEGSENDCGRTEENEKDGKSVVTFTPLGIAVLITKEDGRLPLKVNSGSDVPTLNDSTLLGILIVDESSVATVGSNDEAVTLSL